MLLDGIGCDGFIWRHLKAHFAPRFVLHPHYRGHGRSGRPSDLASASVSQLAADAELMLDNFGVTKVVVLGHSMGVQVALELARRAPHRVVGLGLLCGAPGHMLDGMFGRHDWDERTKQLQGVVQRHAGLVKLASRLVVPTRLTFELARRLEIHPELVDYEDFLPYLIGITHTDMEFFFALLREAMAHDATDVLPTLHDVPTVVIAGLRDRMIHAARSEAMAAQIPSAHYVAIEDGSHVTPIERAERVNDAIAALLSRVEQN
ncbi:MAG: alpha/beta hydrolase [Myxococcales bacterium]|nr:alpha/beta hydrolase [Myxococcales bacterium]